MDKLIKSSYGIAILGACFLLAIFFINWAGKQIDSIVLYIPAGSQTAQVISTLSDGLVAHYTFDDTANDSAGTNNGTVSGGATYTEGKIGRALKFDGVDDTVNAGSATTLDNMSAISVSMWVRQRSLGGGGSQGIIINKDTSYNSVGWRLFNGNSSGAVAFTASFDGGTNLVVTSVNNVLSPTSNVWTYITATWDGTANSSGVHIYKNGTEVAYAAGNTSGIGNYRSDASGLLNIGATNGLSRRFDGSLDDVRIYNRALTPQEITELYNYTGSSGITPASPPATNSSPSLDTTALTPSVSATTPNTISTTFYIRDGSTSLTCTDWTNACDTLPATLVRGATYYIADGMYPSYTFDDPVDGEKYVTIKKATQSEHGTDVGWNSTYGDGVAEWAATIMFRTNYINFDGVTGGGPQDWSSGHGFKISSLDNVIFLMFSDKYGAQKSRVDVSYINISHIELVGRTPVTPGYGTGFDASANLAKANNINISYCYVHDMGGVSFRFQRSSNILVEKCYVARNASDSTHHGTAFRMDDFDGLILRYSLFEDIVGTGFVGGYDTGVKNVNIYGNVFYDTPGFSGRYGNGVIYSIVKSGPIQNWKIYNNSFVNLPASPVIWINNSAGNNQVFNNLLYRVAGPLIHGGVEFSGNNLVQPNNPDPFVGWSQKLFQITQPLSVAATFAAPFNRDGLGNTRGSDGTWDIGAYEYTGNGGTVYSPADFNSDGRVNTTDFYLLTNDWNKTNSTYDLNKDGIVNSLDYVIMVQGWTG